MKQFITLSIIATLMAACSTPDKKAQLDALKKERVNLTAQIDSLKKQIAMEDGNTNNKIKDVLITALVPGQFRHYIDVQGKVDAEESVFIQPQIPGLVTKIFVNEGDEVKSGQVLAEIENSAYTAQLNTLKPQLDLATDVYDRQKRLWEQKIGSEIQFLQARTTKESLEKQIALVMEQIEMTKIKSSINGTIDHIGAKVGQFASPQNPDPSFRVVNLSKLKVTAEVAEAYTRQVVKGGKVIITVPDLQKEIDSRITYVARYINPLTRTFTTEVELSGDNNIFRPNMLTVLKIIDYQSESALTLPVNVIQDSGESKFVYIVSDENGKTIARKKNIVVGQSYNSITEIISGLAPNDRVVTTGQTDITDGMEIRF